MSITSKQRAYLRSLANDMPVQTQLGKEGVSEKFAAEIAIALAARELIKINVLPASGMTAREGCTATCAACGAEPVQCIGNKFVIFRQRSEKSAYELPR